MQLDPLMFIVEDDAAFARTLKRSFERRDYRVVLAEDIEQTKDALNSVSPTHAVVDLKLGIDSGLEAVQALYKHNSAMLIVVLTGFASIATAVNAIKLGACNYLVKPSNTDDIEAAFQAGRKGIATSIPARTTSIKTLEWERIHETLVETGFNISETARRLGMHRRTLARKLEKRRVR